MRSCAILFPRLLRDRLPRSFVATALVLLFTSPLLRFGESGFADGYMAGGEPGAASTAHLVGLLLALVSPWLAEGVVSMVGAAVFLLLAGELEIDYSLLPSLLTGSFVAALTAPFMVHFIPIRIYRVLVPAYALLIGVFVLLRLYAP